MVRASQDQVPIPAASTVRCRRSSSATSLEASWQAMQVHVAIGTHMGAARPVCAGLTVAQSNGRPPDRSGPSAHTRIRHTPYGLGGEGSGQIGGIGFVKLGGVRLLVGRGGL